MNFITYCAPKLKVIHDCVLIVEQLNCTGTIKEKRNLKKGHNTHHT